jgi:hypothetical protein
MEGSYNSLVRIQKQNRNAVRRARSKQNIVLVRDQAIAFKNRLSSRSLQPPRMGVLSLDEMDAAGVDLANRYQIHTIAGRSFPHNGIDQKSPIFAHCTGVIFGRPTQIQCIFAIHLGYTAVTGAESMPKPGKL